MSDDIKSDAAILRATAQVLEILAPFNPEDRLLVVSGAALHGGLMDVLFKKASPEVQELLKKVKPRAQR